VIRNYIDPSQPWLPDAWNFNFGRYYHKNRFAHYTPGRHNLMDYCTNISHVSDIFVLKYKYCPWNKNILNRLLNYESKVKEGDSSISLNTEQSLDDTYKYFLNLSHDLKEDYSFNAAFNYCKGIIT
jgi:hypothetical protein